jgi:hypothetical protein
MIEWLCRAREDPLLPSYILGLHFAPGRVEAARGGALLCGHFFAEPSQLLFICRSASCAA